MNNYDEGVGWVLKPPFTTNKYEVSFRMNLNDIHENLMIKSIKFKGKIPYVMLQPTMANKKEYKVACFNLIPKYVIVNTQKNDASKAFSKKPHTDLLNFAAEVLKYFSERCSYAILGCLTRVDIFMNSNGKLVVNELESFEAVYYARSLHQEMEITKACSAFWGEKIKEYIDKN